MSRPMRARGLKPPETATQPSAGCVAPHAGAWIETRFSQLFPIKNLLSRPMRARGLKR